MLALTLLATRVAAAVLAGALRWLANFAVGTVARRLHLPEVVVHGLCLYAAAYVAEVERKASLACPIRVFLDLRRHRSTGPSTLRHRNPARESRAA